MDRKFKIGDPVVIRRDVAGMNRGDVADIVDTLPLHRMYVIKLRNNTSTYNKEGIYNMLPEDLDHYLPEVDVDRLRAGVEAALRMVGEFNQYAYNIRYNNKDVNRPEWEERAKAYETASRELSIVLDTALRKH